MRLSPHIVLETIQRIGLRDPIWRGEPEAMKPLLLMLHHATLFDFGDTEAPFSAARLQKVTRLYAGSFYE